ncbi:hypothetical protein MLD38_032575 [Melastoma candidum]|uniref:Uncharacterized protein n=1 Tax=Melastoma candidum TaxID=119954 RepID=A0ACB9M435_9MYRT|nr:hypothetical protein MLD38_032575 [Melastoma candidum]
MVERKSTPHRSSSELVRKALLGIGYWMQGFRCFPWLVFNFFLKDALDVDPSTLQILQNSANLPMVAKPLYGILSDAFYIQGQHRIPYIALGAFLQAISWLAIALLSPTNISIIVLYLLLSNLGAAIAEVANDAVVAELARQPAPSSLKKSPSSSSSGELQSFVWMASSLGGAFGNLIAGVAIGRLSPRTMFSIFGVLTALQFLVTISVRESSLNLPKASSGNGIKKQLSDLSSALRRPEIAYPITWLAASYAVIPALTGTMFFYQTQHLKIDTSVLGISKVFGQATMLLWSIVYNKYLKSIGPRKLISAIQATMVVLTASDILFVKGGYRNMGFPDSLYVIIISGFLEVILFFKILPFSVLISQVCPPGCEGSLMAFAMSVVALAFIVSGYLGVALASYVGIGGDDFSGLPFGLAIQAACTVLPLTLSSWIPDVAAARQKTSRKSE